MITRRSLCAVLTLAPFSILARVQNDPLRIGVVAPASPETGEHLLRAMQDGLRELGYVDGQNMVLEVHWAYGKLDRLSGFADDFVQRRFDIIVASTSAAAIAAKEATRGTHIPVVTILANDPVGEGLVESLAHPGGNITGTANINAELGPKRLALLKEAFPKMSRLAVLYYAVQPGVMTQLNDVKSAAKGLPCQLLAVEAKRPEEFETAFATISKWAPDALLVIDNPMFYFFQKRIVGLTMEAKLPAMFSAKDHVMAGGLMSYGASYLDLYRRAAGYIDKIAKGADPADLPIQQPVVYELAINLKTAKALGITIPQSLLIRADDVIQ